MINTKVTAIMTPNELTALEQKLILMRDLRAFLLRVQPRGEGGVLEAEVKAWLNCKTFLDHSEKSTLEAIKRYNSNLESKEEKT